MSKLTDQQKYERLALKIDPKRERLPDIWMPCADPAVCPCFDPRTNCNECNIAAFTPIDFTSESGVWPMWEWAQKTCGTMDVGNSNDSPGRRLYDAITRIDECFRQIGFNGYTSADFRREAFELIFNAVFPSEGE